MGAYDRVGDLMADARWGCANPTATDIGCGAWDYVLEDRRYEAQAQVQRRIDEAAARREWAQAQTAKAARAFAYMTPDERRIFETALREIAPARNTRALTP